MSIYFKKKSQLLLAILILFSNLFVFQNCKETNKVSKQNIPEPIASITPYANHDDGSLSGKILLNAEIAENKSFMNSDRALRPQINLRTSPIVENIKCNSKCQTPYCAELFFLTLSNQSNTNSFCEADLLQNKTTKEYSYRFDLEKMSSAIGHLVLIKVTLPPTIDSKMNQIRYGMRSISKVNEFINLSLSTSLQTIFIQPHFEKNWNNYLDQDIDVPKTFENFIMTFTFTRISNYLKARDFIYDNKTQLNLTLPLLFTETFKPLLEKIKSKNEELILDLEQLDASGDGTKMVEKATEVNFPPDLQALRLEFLNSIDTDKDGYNNAMDCDSGDSKVFLKKSFLLKEQKYDCGIKYQDFCIGSEQQFRSDHQNLTSDRLCTDTDLKASCFDYSTKTIIKHGQFITEHRYKKPIAPATEACESVEVRKYCQDGEFDSTFLTTDKNKNWRYQTCKRLFNPNLVPL